MSSMEEKIIFLFPDGSQPPSTIIIISNLQSNTHKNLQKTLKFLMYIAPTTHTQYLELNTIKMGVLGSMLTMIMI